MANRCTKTGTRQRTEKRLRMARISLVSGFLGATLLGLSAVAPAAEPALDASKPAAVINEISTRDFQSTLATLKAQLAVDKWNVISEINLGQRLAKKDVAIPGGLVILQLTSGKFARPLLAADETRYVSAMMPCSISVYGLSDGRTVFSRMNFEMLMEMFEPRVSERMGKAVAKLNKTVAQTMLALGG